MVFVTFWLSVYKGIQDQAKNDRNFLFPKMNIQLQGQRFEDIVKIQAESQTVLDSIMEQEF
jgi:hypothetical protein